MRSSVSASTGDGVDDLLNLFFKNLKPGEALYPTADLPRSRSASRAEIIREKVLGNGDELPYTQRFGSIDGKRTREELIKIWTMSWSGSPKKPIVIASERKWSTHRHQRV